MWNWRYFSKKLVDDLFMVYGPDDKQKGKFNSKDKEDFLSDDFYGLFGRYWGTEGKIKTPIDLSIDRDVNSITLTIWGIGIDWREVTQQATLGLLQGWLDIGAMVILSLLCFIWAGRTLLGFCLLTCTFISLFSSGSGRTSNEFQPCSKPCSSDCEKTLHYIKINLYNFI